jgi:bacterioferritin (cytochrome b1)
MTTKTKMETAEVKTAKQELIRMLNEALELEHAARIQYLSHRELSDGTQAEPLMARLKDNAEDEARHEAKFRTLIGDYLGGTPSMGIAATHPAETIDQILQTNLNDERHAVDVYKGIMAKIVQVKDHLKYEYFQLEHEIRHIIMEEEEHIAELKILLAQR